MVVTQTWQKIIVLVLAVLLVSFLVFLIVGVLSHDTSNPYYYVNSLDELKKVFKKEPDFLFPDLSKYDFITTYMVGHKPTNKKILTSYSIGGSRTDGNWERSDSVLHELSIGCSKPKLLSNESNPVRELDLNFEHLGVKMSEENYDISNTEGTISDQFPKGSFVFRYTYRFDLGDCRYGLNGLIVVLPDDLSNTDTDALIEQGKNELLKIAESIIIQRSLES